MFPPTDKKLVMLKPDEIRSSPHQPRQSFDSYELKQLSDSIAASGIIQPLSVRRLEDGSFELIAGERRLKAAITAGLRRVPCYILKANDEAASLYAIIENLQRSNLTVFEEAAAINRLIKKYGVSQSEAAARLGIAQSTLSNKLRLLHLSVDIQQRIVSAGLCERHARSLLRLPPDAREPVLDYIIAHGLNIAQTENYIFNLLNPEEEVAEEKQPVRRTAIGDVRLFTNSLAKLLGTLNNAGINAKSRKYETDKYIEFKVRIEKNTTEKENYSQLKIC